MYDRTATGRSLIIGPRRKLKKCRITSCQSRRRHGHELVDFHRVCSVSKTTGRVVFGTLICNTAPETGVLGETSGMMHTSSIPAPPHQNSRTTNKPIPTHPYTRARPITHIYRERCNDEMQRGKLDCREAARSPVQPPLLPPAVVAWRCERSLSSHCAGKGQYR